MSKRSRSPATVGGPLPAVDSVLRAAPVAPLVVEYGQTRVAGRIREVFNAMPKGEIDNILLNHAEEEALPPSFVGMLADGLEEASRPLIREVMDLIGTVLHTNLGRALLPEAAAEAVKLALTRACNIEYDLETGARGEAANRILPVMAAWAGRQAEAEVVPCFSQIGSGALPVEQLESATIRLTPAGKPGGADRAVIARKLRRLPVPVIGRIHQGAVWVDLRGSHGLRGEKLLR